MAMRTDKSSAIALSIYEQAVSCDALLVNDTMQ